MQDPKKEKINGILADLRNAFLDLPLLQAEAAAQKAKNDLHELDPSLDLFTLVNDFNDDNELFESLLFALTEAPNNDAAQPIKLKLEYLFNQLPAGKKPPLTTTLLSITKKNDLAFLTLLRLYSAQEILAVQNDKKNKNRPIMAEFLVLLVRNGLIEDFEKILSQEPSLVNTLVQDHYEGIEKTPLWLYVWESCHSNYQINRSFMNCVLNKNPNIELTRSDGSNILHLAMHLGVKENTYYGNDPILRWVLNQENAYRLIDAENKIGDTPLKIGILATNTRDLVDELVKMHIQHNMDYPQAMIETYNSKFSIQNIMAEAVSSPSETKQSISLTALPMSFQGVCLAMLAKAEKRKSDNRAPLNAHLFPNKRAFFEYLNSMINNQKYPQIVNAVIYDKSHMRHVFCIVHDKTHMDMLQIDAALGADNYAAPLKRFMQENHMEGKVLESGEWFQASFVHCGIIAMELAEKLSRLNYEDACLFFNTLSAKASQNNHQTLQLIDFPLWLGIVALCQSVTKINLAKETLQAQLQEAVNHRNETLEQVLSRGIEKNEQGKDENLTLGRKSESHLRRAGGLAEKLGESSLKDERILEEVADLLGIKEICSNWKEVTTLVLTELNNWQNLRNVNYSQLDKKIENEKTPPMLTDHTPKNSHPV